MNRTLMIVICDFIILSLLALARFDSPPTPTANPGPTAQATAAARPEMVAALEQALSVEQSARQSTEAELAEREASLVRREEEIQRLADHLDRTRQDLAETAAAKSALASSLKSTEEESIAARERARLLQEQFRKQEEALAQREGALRQLTEEQRQLERDRQLVATELQVREAEKQILQENLRSAQAQIETIRVEKQEAERRAESLTRHVDQLAQDSSALREEFRLATPLSPHLIYARHRVARVEVLFEAELEGLAGIGRRQFPARGLAVFAGDQVWVMLAAADTPFRLESLRSLVSARGSLQLADGPAEIAEVRHLASDPRLLLVAWPANRSAPAALTLSGDPLRFPEALLIGREDGTYGQAPFRLVPGEPGTLTMERGLFRSLVGAFNPGRGDWAYTMAGELLGPMVDNSHCRLLRDLSPSPALPLGGPLERAALVRLHALLSESAAAAP